MSTIQALCSVPVFLKGITKLCLETKEMRAYSKETIDMIDEFAKTYEEATDDDWTLSIAPWSNEREWKWLGSASGGEDDAAGTLPVYMEKFRGPMSSKLRAILPGNILGEATALYTYIKMVSASGDEDEDEAECMLSNAFGKDLSISDGDVVFALFLFPDCAEPLKIDIDFDAIKRKLVILKQVLPTVDGFYTQSY